MPNRATMGEKLAAMRKRAKMSMDDVARAGGWRGRSSVQRFFAADYDPEYLPWDVAQKLIIAFRGKLAGPSYVNELFMFAGVSSEAVSSIFSVKEQLGSVGGLPRDVPIYGTALGGEAKYELSEGTGSLSVEQAELNQSEILGYLTRPPALEGRKDVYGVYVSGTSMFPRFGDGEPVFVDPKRPARAGDDVIVQLVAPDDHDGDRVVAVLIKRLVRRTAAYVELCQFNPSVSFRIEAASVKVIHRIVPPGELLS